NVNCTDDYRDWISIGFALAMEMGENGRQHFHALSAISGKYDSQKCDKKYDNLLKSEGKGNGKKSSIATVYWYAKQAGIELYDQEAKNFTRPVSNQKRKGAQNTEDIVQALKTSGTNNERLEQIAEEVLKNPTPQEPNDLLLDVTIYLQSLN